MKRERGFFGLGPLIQLAIVAAVVLAIGAAVMAWRSSLITLGAERERAAWTERDRVAAEASAKETQRRLERLGDANRETAQAIARSRAAAGRAAAAADSLQHDLDAATAARRSADPAAVAQCAPAEADRDLHADLRRLADEAAGKLAAYGDDARTAGEACEREHDALTGAKP